MKLTTVMMTGMTLRDKEIDIEDFSRLKRLMEVVSINYYFKYVNTY